MDLKQQLEAALGILETEINGCNAKEREAIDKAREYNAISRQARLDRTALEAKAEPLRKQLADIAAEAKRQAIAKAKAEAEAAAKARAEAEAKEKEAKAKEASELEKAKAEIEQLKSELAAKG